VLNDDWERTVDQFFKDHPKNALIFNPGMIKAYIKKYRDPEAKKVNAEKAQLDKEPEYKPAKEYDPDIWDPIVSVFLKVKAMWPAFAYEP